MCDFRVIKKIKLMDYKGTIVDVEGKVKHIPWDAIEINTEKLSGPGLYHIMGTGGCHMYYNGKEWLDEVTDYEIYFRNEYQPQNVNKMGWRALEYETNFFYGSGSELK